MSVASPIDWRAVRRGLCQAVTACTGLGQNAVLLAQPERRNAPLPAYPFVLFTLTTPAARMAADSLLWDGSGFVLAGPRQCSVAFDCYGDTHDDAWGLASCLQQGLDGPEAADALTVAGLSVWGTGDVLDLSALMDTGFEGRARLTMQFGLAARRGVSLTDIRTVPLHGAVQTDGGHELVADGTVSLETP